MAKMERPCPPMVMLAFPLLAILTLRGLMRLRLQQMPQPPLVDIIEADASGNPHS